MTRKRIFTVGAALAACVAVTFVAASAFLGESADARRARTALESFIKNGGDASSAAEVLAMDPNRYEEICIFVDKDSQPDSAETAFKEKFKDRSVVVEDFYYGAIIALASPNELDVIQFNSNNITAEGRRYWLHFELSGVRGEEGCASMRNAYFKTEASAHQSVLVLFAM